ncbi:MAG TPA: flagellar protein FliT [Gammaproteobacteria bacterium]|nr:flagellar protein FliT [Gammaproteobacteria bacterium]
MPTADRKDAVAAFDAWQEVVALTRKMTESVHAGEIERMVELEGRRHRLLSQVFCNDKPRPPVDEIQQVMRMDAEIVRRAEALRGELLAKLNTLSSNRKALAAYGQFQQSGS